MMWVMLFIVVMAVLVAGTRLALARPAHWFCTPPEDGSPPGAVWLISIAVVSVVPFEVLSAPVYFLFPVAGLAVLAVLFTRTTARSWTARGFVFAASTVPAVGWAWAASWESYSLAAVFVTLAVIAVVRPRLSFWLATASMTLIALLDFYQVAVTQATVRSVATGDPFADRIPDPARAPGIPGLIGISAHVAPLTHYTAILGIGDVTLPGMLIVIAARVGQLTGTPWLYRAAVTGYGIALAACITVVATTHAPMPAMTFLIPGVVIAVATTARRAGAWPALASRDPRRQASLDAPPPEPAVQ
jgi:hypothetical protein